MRRRNRQEYGPLNLRVDMSYQHDELTNNCKYGRLEKIHGIEQKCGTKEYTKENNFFNCVYVALKWNSIVLCVGTLSADFSQYRRHIWLYIHT